MKQWYPISILTAAIIIASACAKNQNQIKIPEDAARMTVAFSWEGVQPCTHASPQIQVSDIPEGTRSFQVKLTNLEVPAWNQGGGKAPNDGSGIIPAGALNIGYNGPCPPPKQRYKYEFLVLALDDQGAIIGFGKARRVFPPKE
jgi:phosphatidylethanolamine-binding protein (PEBP) family uncharacterized protein